MTQNDDGRDRKVTVKLPRDVIDNWMGSCEPANEAERTLAGMLIEAVQAHEAWLKNQADVAAHGQLCDYCEGVGILEAGSDGSDCPVCGGTGRVANTGQGQDRLKDLELGLGTFSGWVKRLHSTMGEVLNRHGETLNGLSEHIVNLHERFERTDEVIYELRKVLDGLTGHVVNMNDKLMGEIIDCADDASRDARVFDEKLDGMAEHIVNLHERLLEDELVTAKTRMDRIEWSPGLRGCGYTAEMKRWVRGQLHPLGRRITELERKLEGK